MMACPASGAQPCELTTAMTNFAASLYTELSKENAGTNILYSPYSIFAALAMTMLGAHKNTLTEMQNGMHLDKVKSDEMFHAMMGKKLKEFVSGSEGVQVDLANKLFVEQTYELKKLYLDTVKKAYEAETKQVDFKGAAQTVRSDINKWVEQITKDKIKDLIPADAVNDMTRLILVNAIYFKGLWLSQFEKEATRDGPFYKLDGTSKQVKMMHSEKEFEINRNKDLDCQMVKLPFKDTKYSMIIVLPNQRDGITQLESKLTGATLTSILGGGYRKTKILLTLPKFKMESSFGLANTLKKLGMKEMFSQGGADFSAMTASNDLFVSSVVHKAFLEVDECGAEAAAATAVVMMMRCMPAPPREFTVDHPFIVAIIDADSVPVFMGRIHDL